MKKIHCIALLTGYAANSSVSWAFFTHHVGFASPTEALIVLGEELLARYRERGFKTVSPDEGVITTDKLDPTMFIAFVNHLLRGAWGDFGDPDTADGRTCKWWPFTDFENILGISAEETIIVGSMAAEVILAAIDKSLLTSFDVREICDNMPAVAAALGLKFVAEQEVVAIGTC